MRMNKKLKNLLVVGMAASFVLNSAAGVVFAEELGTEVETEVSTETETPDESAGWDSETVEESLTDGITVYSAPEDLTGAPATLAVYYKTADGVMVSAKVIQREQEDLTATEYTFTTEDLTVPEGYRCVGEFSQTVAYGGHGQATVTVELDTVEAKPATLAVYYKTADGVMVSA
ncbi:MAG: hypothetical protein Q4C61_11775, partial [Lachnospiraceae bacterium]|nr:hypothetical protein [Lachnospiraceae bacterium]